MKNRSLQLSIAAVTLIGMATLMTGCGDNQESPIIDSSASLDKSYVPALFYSNISPVPNEPFALNDQATFGTLESEWESYQNSVGNFYGLTNLTPYYTGIDSNISAATTLIDEVVAGTYGYPADISEAHNALETVRDIFAEMRETISIDYFMDSITEAHHKMEPVSGAYTTYDTDGNITQLCASLETHLPAFSQAWEELSNDYSETRIADLYDLGSEKSAQLTANINGMNATLDALDTAMADCVTNEADVDAQTAKIKPIFVKFFLAFGDFITPFMSDMIAMEKSFIPVLYCTSNPPDVDPTCGGLAGTQTLLNTFEAANTALQAHYPIIPGKLNTPATIYWNTDFGAANTAIANAQAVAGAAATTADLVPAHDELENVRSAMYHLRTTFENYNFITDRVTDYHNAMEPIAIVVKPLVDPSEVNQTVKDTIAAALPGSLSAMSTLEKEVPALDLDAYGYTSDWLDNQNTSIAAQLANLQQLQTALDEDNATVILNTAKQVKPLFVPFFKAFGSF